MADSEIGQEHPRGCKLHRNLTLPLPVWLQSASAGPVMVQWPDLAEGQAVVNGRVEQWRYRRCEQAPAALSLPGWATGRPRCTSSVAALFCAQQSLIPGGRCGAW